MGQSKTSSVGHELSLKELLLAKLCALEKLWDERSLRYEEHFKYLRERYDAAIAEVKNSALVAKDVADSALEKALKSQADYNAFHNDLMRKIEKERQLYASQTDLARLEKELAENTRWRVGIAVAILLGLASLVMRFIQ